MGGPGAGETIKAQGQEQKQIPYPALQLPGGKCIQVRVSFQELQALAVTLIRSP